MYTLNIANKNYSSWSLRPWILLQALQIPFKENLIPFAAPGEWEKFRNILPSGKVPCLQDGEQLVWDSLAIVEYLAEAHPQVWPSDKATRAWSRSLVAEMHSGFQTLRNICSMNCGVRVQLNEISADLKKDMARIEDLWSEGLKKFGGPYLAGNKFTAVDAFYAPIIFRIQTYQLPVRAETKKYMQTMWQLPAMKAWYESALKETWRDQVHDDDLVKFGKVIEDLRC
ncbi:MAG: glutathione S-transferase family protein [Bacteriovoracaceae bacterium]|nr:glutathione S-transferase family protein [Bacteriovoracaceae bacterium]